MKLHFDYEEENGLTYRCNFEGTLEEYAMMWLNLTNNAREYKGVFREIRNTYSNIIYVTVNKRYKEETESYLKSLDLIIEHIEPCKIIVPFIDYEYDGVEVVFANIQSC